MIWQILSKERTRVSEGPISSGHLTDMPSMDPEIVRVSADSLEVGLICADRDGNRIRIDSVDRAGGRVTFHYLNDELRVQEGVQQRSVADFLAQGWRMAASGRL